MYGYIPDARLVGEIGGVRYGCYNIAGTAVCNMRGFDLHKLGVSGAGTDTDERHFVRISIQKRHVAGSLVPQFRSFRRNILNVDVA